NEVERIAFLCAGVGRLETNCLVFHALYALRVFGFGLREKIRLVAAVARTGGTALAGRVDVNRHEDVATRLVGNRTAIVQADQRVCRACHQHVGSLVAERCGEQLGHGQGDVLLEDLRAAADWPVHSWIDSAVTSVDDNQRVAGPLDPNWSLRRNACYSRGLTDLARCRARSGRVGRCWCCPLL